MAAPIEAKVQAAGVAGAAAGVVLWVLQTYAFKGNSVPAGLVSLVDVAVPGILALAGGYLAPHTPRPPVLVTVPMPSGLPPSGPPLQPPPVAPPAPPAGM
jgi:hypothetical protein